MVCVTVLFLWSGCILGMSCLSGLPLLPYYAHVFSPIALISSSLSMTVSPSTEVNDTEEISVTLYVSLGVGGAVLVLIVTAIICLRMRLYECKPASVKTEHIYDYISTTDGNATVNTSPNEAYADSIPASDIHSLKVLVECYWWRAEEARPVTFARSALRLRVARI